MSAPERPRLGSPGWLFLAAAGFALLYPLLKYWPGGHPLASQREPDACALARQTASAFTPAPGDWTPGDGPAPLRKASCRGQWAATPEADPPPTLDLLVFTQASLSAQGTHAKTDKWFATNLAELRASGGGDAQMLKGPWKQGALVLGRNGRISLLVEDGGAGFLIHAHRLPSAPLRDWADALSTAMRAHKS